MFNILFNILYEINLPIDRIKPEEMIENLIRERKNKIIKKSGS